MTKRGEDRDDDTPAHLLRLLQMLRESRYAFVTPTPATHARVLARPGRQEARTIEDVLGWSLPFAEGVLPPAIEACLEAAGVLATDGSFRSCKVRVSSLRGQLYVHSAYPTADADAVFFGPDSYRFASLLARELDREPPTDGARIIDIGTGAGVGAVTAASLCPNAKIIMTDVNRRALRLAEVNVAAAGMHVAAIETQGLEGIDGRFDVAAINPPYIMDDGERTYRDGGAMHGAALSLELAQAAFERLNPGGRVILYTGSAIVRGADALRDALSRFVDERGGRIAHAEIDPDVFGEELAKPQYHDVDRIALVSAVLRRPA